MLLKPIILLKFAPCLKITKKIAAMSRVCELTGKKAMVGNNVSHAMNKTKRKFNVNLMKKRFYIPEEDKWITLKVSTSALKNINKKGISAVIKEARANGILSK
ncbi:MAG: large subunit ribosomal protein L28 [Saprospiraceae bacterium]